MQTWSPLAFYYFSLIMACQSLILENSTYYCEHEKQTCFHKVDVPLGKWGLSHSMANYRFWLCLLCAQTREGNTKNPTETWMLFEKEEINSCLYWMQSQSTYNWILSSNTYDYFFLWERETHLIRILQSLICTVITDISKCELIRFLNNS